MKLVGANANAEVVGGEQLPGKVNYFIGNDSKKWRTNISTYGKVKYRGVYEGVDLVYYGNQGKLEYDFVVSPGADPRAIKIAFEGADEIKTDGGGDLIIGTSVGDLRMHKPLVYQEVDGVRKEVLAAFVFNPKSKVVGFEVAKYDSTTPLIIDPILSYSSYLGGSGSEIPFYLQSGIAVDASGAAYVTGFTTSTDFPTENAFQPYHAGNPFDAFVIKIDPSQNGADSVIYSTYLGGNANDQGRGIAVDSFGNAYVTGSTLSSNFPIANALQPFCNCGGDDIFVTKFTADGSVVVYSTYLGGSGTEYGLGIALDAAKNAYVTGITTSYDFPVVNAFQTGYGGNQDAFIAKIIFNTSPTANASGPYAVAEGGTLATLTGSGSDPDGDSLTYSWDLDNNGIFETVGQNPIYSAVGRDGSSSQTVVLRVCDTQNACATSPATVNITNIAPTVGVISAPVAPVQVNTAITANATFTDPGVLDTHTAIWSWGDSTTSAGTVTETNGSGSVTGSHVYTVAGVYTVTLTVTDDDGGSGQSVFQFVVVYDPNAGFVTGGGWIDSPAGAYVPNSFLTGKANFGFVSHYRPGKIVPEGQTEFRFNVANFNFHSSNYEWLVVGGPRAQYKGTGTINGVGNYNFILTAIDGQVSGGGGVDKFRIKIWSSGGVVYDNQMGAGDDATPTTQLGGGSIVIHTK